MNHLCTRCKILELDDKALGGHRIRDSEGKQSLELPYNHPDKDGVGNVPLDYHLLDEFPGFPKLVTASHAGCDFCKLLKDAIDRFVKFEEEVAVAVEITMSYRWSKSWNGKFGLTGLFVTLRLAVNAIARRRLLFNDQTSLRFLIDGEPGV